MTVKIKICGIKREIDTDFINSALPDYTGFVFAPSKRQIGLDFALKLKNLLNPEIKTAGVFVNADEDEILSCAHSGVIDIIQLHGNEDEDYIKRIKNKTNLPVIKAFKGGAQDKITTSADYILLDSAQNNAFGGTGKTFDWTKIPKLNKPLFLAGGINTQNIKEALKIKPFCIDVSSGVETKGFKDGKKIKEVVKLVRSIEACENE